MYQLDLLVRIVGFNIGLTGNSALSLEMLLKLIGG